MPDSMTSTRAAALRAAVIDGRAHNIFYRIEQLEKLYDTLASESQTIIEAIITDSEISQAEAKIEFVLALNSLRDRYAELQPSQELKEEYAIANHKDAKDLRVGFGLVLIKVAKHSPFFSAVATLGAAIAAGNCVVLEVSSCSQSSPWKRKLKQVV